MFAYGLPPCQNASKCTWEEASNRLIYTTIGGSPALSRRPDPALTWGDITLIFANVKDMIGIVPLDSGDWGLLCVPNPSPEKSWPPFPKKPDAKCMQSDYFGSMFGAWWPPVLGTFGALDHLLLLQAAQSPDAGGRGGCNQDTLPSPCFGCGWVRDTLLQGPVRDINWKSSTHWEGNIVGSIRYGHNGTNRSVKALVVSFVRHFGRPSGNFLRTWCKERHWPLLWSACFLKTETSPLSSDCLDGEARD